MTLTKRICEILKDGKPRTAVHVAALLGEDVQRVRDGIKQAVRTRSVKIEHAEVLYCLSPEAALRNDVKDARIAKERAVRQRRASVKAAKAARDAQKAANDRLRSEEQLVKVERARLRYQAQTQIKDAVAGKVANSVFAWGQA